ncbi:unnamed protein product [Durusdinium trenchii]|uniref:Uncharacterized protein n=1 Tax=Durusdinium trenchii TaxID=1381693 RepID=A0ABP0LHR9_9DINO
MARFQVVVLAFLFVNFNLTGAKRTVFGSGNSMDVASSVPESDSLLDLDCDVDAEDQEIYGPKLQSRLCPKIIGCSFWDACRRLEDKSCPSNCRPWKEEVSQSRLLRMYTWVKRKTSGSCPRYCRYKDEEMLKPGVSSGFMASSAAVLATNVPTLVAECSGSIASLSCINQMAEASSVMGFIGRAISKAKELAKEGKIKECKEVLPDSLASGLGDSVAQYIGFLHQLGGIDATLLEEKEVGASKAKKQEKAKWGWEVLQRKTFARICEEPNEGDVKLAKSLSEEDLKKVVEKASKGIMTAEQADSVAKKIQTEGVEKLSDELLTQEEEAVEKTLQNADKAASLLALQANETLPGSLMELSQANELQLQGFFNGMISLLTSILARVLYLATGGAFSLVVCLLSFGMLTDDSGIGVHKELTLSQQLIWPLTCPVMVLRYAAGFGSNPDDRDVFYDVLGDDSLSWVGVIDAFQS